MILKEHLDLFLDKKVRVLDRDNNVYTGTLNAKEHRYTVLNGEKSISLLRKDVKHITLLSDLK